MLSRLLNLFFPPQCLLCRSLISQHGVLCAECWTQVNFITEPMCARCGFPFDFALGEGALCASCIHTPPEFTQARACFRYDGFSRALILRFKYQDETHVAPVYAEWLAQAGKALIQQSEVIIPVPLHRWRFLRRRYNQAALLARSVSKRTGLPLLTDGLARTRHTRPQAGLTRAQRKENLQGAFAVPPNRALQMRGKTILLVDDVMTTGSTLLHCSKALRDAGASQIFVLTLARRV